MIEMIKRFFRFIILIVIFLSGYFFGTVSDKNVNNITNTNSQIPTPTINQVEKLLENKDPEIRLVILFENFQEEENAYGVLSLFTPPETEEEKEGYSFLYSFDLGPTYPRLYTIANLLYRVTSYNIIKSYKENDIYTIEVEELRKGWDNMNGEWIEHKKNMIFELKRFGNYLFIDKYYEKDTPPNKYSGFYN